MSIRRFIVSVGLVLIATISGTMFSLRPVTTEALPDAGYVALGDSVAAGAGLPVMSGGEACGQSAEAYPYAVAAGLGVAVQQLACGGAKVDEGLYGSQEVAGNKLTPQIDAAFASGSPDIMTITIGANDMRWVQFIRDCYLTSCGSAWDNARMQAYLLDLRWELYVALYKIWQKSNGDVPRVYITGYYDPLGGKACAATPNITTDEAAWFSEHVTSVNAVIRDAALSAPFATYVPISFAGHEVCSEVSWIQGMKDPAPIHPTTEGQSHIAQTVLDVIGSDD